jgi:hypothetical protein
VEAVENLKMTERYANVIENKGPAFSSPGPIVNVIENTGSYELKAGMLLEGRDVGGGRTGFRNQEPQE